MIRSALLLLPTLALAAPALADEAKPSKPKLECRSFPRTNGRFTDDVCRTHEEWAAYDEAAKNNADGLVNGVLRSAGQSGGSIAQTGAPR